MEVVSVFDCSFGLTDWSQMEQGWLPHDRCVTLILMPAPGVSMLPLSSAARVLMLSVLPGLPGVNVYVQLAAPWAGCHVVPPSSDTSMPPTWPPVSVAVPTTVTGVPLGTLEPLAGAVIVEVGAVVSVDAPLTTRPAIGVVGCAFMSARMLIVACCTLASAVEAAIPPPTSCTPSRPKDQSTVPAPKTSAWLGAR